jgi:hypothetical protein|tara:strand:+ start:727 stop:1173 length:447 start_codon:yes stop_codon:yes gene_type:complete
MKFDSEMAMKGRLTIALNDEVVQEVDNLVVTTGKNFVASRMIGTTPGVMSHMAIGTGTTAAAAGDSALGSQVEIQPLTSSAVGSGSNANDVTYIATFAAGEPSSAAAITEAGIFNASSSGVMLCRTVFAVVNKQPSDSMSITWTITAS